MDQGKTDMVKAILSERKRREGEACPESQKSEHHLGDDYGISHVEEGTEQSEFLGDGFVPHAYSVHMTRNNKSSSSLGMRT